MEKKMENGENVEKTDEVKEVFGEWVSVEDRLPEYYKPVLCYIPTTPCQTICWRASDGDNYIYTIYQTDIIISKVTHWMPLPKPPIS